MIIDNAIVIEETDITANLGGRIYSVFNITIAVDTDQGPYQVQTFSIKDAFRRANESKPQYDAPIYFKGINDESPKLVDDVLKLQLYLTYSD
jgi:hypothetical protein